MARRTKKIIVTLAELQINFRDVGFNVDKRWLNRLSKEKDLPKLALGKYDLVECLKWLVKYIMVQRDEALEKRTGRAKAEEDLIRAKARREEIKLQKESGEYVKRSIIISEYHKLILPIRNQLLNISNTINQQLENKSMSERKNIIDDAIHNILNDFTKY